MNLQSEHISQLIESTISGLGFELVGVELAIQGKGQILRVYIDHKKGVDIDDCQSISHQISGVLEVEDPIPGQYSLEVSSPGIERPLFKAEDYVRFKGLEARVQLKELYQGRRKLVGILQGLDNGDVLLEVDGEMWNLSMVTIHKAHLTSDL